MINIRKEKSKGLRNNNFTFFALRFGSDLFDPIEQNRSNSIAISRILRLRIEQRCPEDEMRKCEVIIAQALRGIKCNLAEFNESMLL